MHWSALDMQGLVLLQSTYILHTVMFSIPSPELTSFLYSWHRAAEYEHTIRLAEPVVSLAVHTGGDHLVAGTLVRVSAATIILTSYLSLRHDGSESSRSVMVIKVTRLLL